MSAPPDLAIYIEAAVTGIIILAALWIIVARARRGPPRQKEATTVIPGQRGGGKGNHRDRTVDILERIATALERVVGDSAPQELNGPATRLLALADQCEATAKLFPTMTLPIVEVAKSIRGAVGETTANAALREQKPPLA